MKAISPLIAVVMLIAATMMIAAAISVWTQSFVQQKLGNQTLECPPGRIDVYSLNYDQATKTLRLILESKSGFELKNLTLYVFYPEAKLQSFSLEGTLPAGKLASFEAKQVEPGFIKVRVNTECIEIYVERST